MLSITLIFVGMIINFVCIWCVKSLLDEEVKLLRKHYVSFAVAGIIGALLSFLLNDHTYMNTVLFAVYGAAVIEVITILFLSIMNKYQSEEVENYYDNQRPGRFFITGDKHRDFSIVRSFCKHMKTKKKDVLIVLGDSGFNYYGDERDDKLKEQISKLNITLFCIHGNKEQRPQNISTYGIRDFCGGRVYYEPRYPNILFAIDAQVYTFEGRKYMVVGGAHSVDKTRCIEEGLPYWNDEMPDPSVRSSVEIRLRREKYKIYGMLTHTCPVEYLPSEMFVSTKRRKRKVFSLFHKKDEYKPDINRSTELWLGELERKLNYKVWYCGHFHTDKDIKKIRMMYHMIRPLHIRSKA